MHNNQKYHHDGCRYKTANILVIASPVAPFVSNSPNTFVSPTDTQKVLGDTLGEIRLAFVDSLTSLRQIHYSIFVTASQNRRKWWHKHVLILNVSIHKRRRRRSHLLHHKHCAHTEEGIAETCVY